MICAGRKEPSRPQERNDAPLKSGGAAVNNDNAADTVILTIGNEYMGDDGAGCVLGRLLHSSPGIAVVEGGTAPENLLGKIVRMRPRLIVVVDALDHGGSPGDVRILRPDEIRGEATSTHGTTSLMMMYLARATGAEIRIMGIQPGRLTPGGLSTPVRRAIGQLASLVAVEGIREVIRRVICEGMAMRR